MKPARDGESPEQLLRRHALALIDARLDNVDDGSVVEVRELLHELQVHQTELQLQNEELVRLRDDLESAHDRYRALYDHAPIGYLSLDADGRILQANHFAGSLFGKPRGELVGGLFSSFVSQDSLLTFHHHWQQVLSSTTPQTCSLEARIEPGKHLRLRLTSAREEGNGPAHCRVIIADETSIWRATSEAATHAERMRAILDTATDAIVTIDRHGVILEANVATERLFRQPLTDMVGRNVSFLMPTGHAEAHDGYIARYLRGGAAGVIGRGREVEALRADGTRFPAWLSVGELEIRGERLFTGILHDLSDRKRLEARSRRAESMEALGRLSAGVAHDFKNLLAGVMGLCDVAVTRLSADHPVSEMLQLMRESAERGFALVGQLLSFARTEPGPLISLVVNDVILEVRALTAHLLGDGVELQLFLCDKPTRVLGDRLELEQVLLNLLANAGEATPGTGRVRLSTYVVKLEANDPSRPDELAPGPYVAIEVSDSGVGIDEDLQGKIFEPFFTTKGGRGTGLGLASVYGIVKRHRGAVDVTSAPGKGATFRVLLPAHDGPAVAPRTRKGLLSTLPVSHSERGTILLVHHNPMVRISICHHLETAGHRVLSAASAVEATALARGFGEPIDLMVVQMRLPGTPGPLLAQQLEAVHPDMAVLCVSAEAGQGADEVEALPPDYELLSKPVDPEQLMLRVAALLSRRSTS